MPLVSQGVLGLLVGLLLSLVPSLLFVGLWRGLVRLRNDRLVDDVLARVEQQNPGATTVEPHAFLASGRETNQLDITAAREDATAVSASLSADTRRLEQCPECGVLRPTGNLACPTCGESPG